MGEEVSIEKPDHSICNDLAQDMRGIPKQEFMAWLTVNLHTVFYVSPTPTPNVGLSPGTDDGWEYVFLTSLRGFT